MRASNWSSDDLFIKCEKVSSLMDCTTAAEDEGGAGGSDTTATEDEGSDGGLAETDVAVAEGMKGAAAADETDEKVGGALGAMVAFFLAATESMYCFMLPAVGVSLANDLASFCRRSIFYGETWCRF